MRQVQPICSDWLLNAPFQACPAEKAVLAGNGKLRIAELELGGKDGFVGKALKARMEFANELRRSQRAKGVGLPQVFGLLFEVVEVGMGRELSYRHDELPFVCPGPHMEG
jgi:hypothetical protein